MDKINNSIVLYMQSELSPNPILMILASGWQGREIKASCRNPLIIKGCITWPIAKGLCPTLLPTFVCRYDIDNFGLARGTRVNNLIKKIVQTVINSDTTYNVNSIFNSPKGYFGEQWRRNAKH